MERDTNFCLFTIICLLNVVTGFLREDFFTTIRSNSSETTQSITYKEEERSAILFLRACIAAFSVIKHSFFVKYVRHNGEDILIQQDKRVLCLQEQSAFHTKKMNNDDAYFCQKIFF